MDLINENENLIHCLKELRDELKIEELEKSLSSRFRIIYRRRGLLEIVPKGYSKASGIEEICRVLSIAREDTYAFGDSTNDLDML